MEVASAIIAAVALTVSVLVFLDNRAREQRAARLARRPALVFTWDEVHGVWQLRNIGNGPALDVLILQRADRVWDHPLRMRELAADATDTVPRRWYEEWHKDPELGANYLSVAEEKYSTKTGCDRSRIDTGWLAVDTADEIEPHWRYRDEHQHHQC
jgi:hypothetical protein